MVPDGTIAGLGLVAWVVLGSWLFLGWRTVAVEAGAGEGAVDNRGNRQAGSATLPPGGVDAAPRGSGAPANGHVPAGGHVTASGHAPLDQGVGPSRGSVSLPK